MNKMTSEFNTNVTSNEEKLSHNDSVKCEVVLNFVDINANENTYYQLQLLDLGSTYILSESTGRFGTCIGDSFSQQSYSTLEQAKAEFKKIYIGKKGFFCSEFCAKNSVKKSGLYNRVDIYNETLSKGFDVQPSIFKLDADCFEEVFDWLSLNDLHAFGQTCKRMQQVAGYYFRSTYPGASVYCQDNGIHCKYVQINGFSDYIENIEFRCVALDCFRFAKSNEFKSIKNIFFYKIEFDHAKVACIKKLLCKAEIVEINNCDSYDGLLEYCANMKRLRVAYCDGGAMMEYDWLLQQYPSLEQLVLKPYGWETIEQLTTFFQRNPSVKYFATAADLLWKNRHSFTNIKLDILSIYYNDSSDVKVDVGHDMLDEFHKRKVYKRLHLFVREHDDLQDTIHQFVPTGTVEKFTCFELPKHVTSLPFVNLKELHSISIPDNIDMEAIAKALVNIERVDFVYANPNQISAFIRRSRKLKHIAIEYICEMEGEVLDVSLWNKEREKLAGAQKVMVYVAEKVFLATKKTTQNQDYRLIEVKRFQSIHRICDFFYF